MVKTLARLAGVSVRTLHHYDAVGLLKPDHVGANGYRYYGREQLLRLQEILVLRELDMGLAEIADVLDAEGPDRAVRLGAHRDRLVADAERRARLIATLDRTIEHLDGGQDMTDEDLYDGIAPEAQAEYEAWLIRQYGGDMPARIAAARRSVVEMPGGRTGLAPKAMDALARFERALVEAFENGTASDAPELAPLLSDHRDWVAAQWGRPCDRNAYAGLADLYLSHPDFVARYEALSPGFSAFITDAMKAYSVAEGPA